MKNVHGFMTLKGIYRMIENRDLLGDNIDLIVMIDSQIKIMKSEISNLRKELNLYYDLYNKINNMVCKLGAEGEINSKDRTVQHIMWSLFEIDGGTFEEKKYEG